jgi:hypothetical protein
MGSGGSNDIAKIDFDELHEVLKKDSPDFVTCYQVTIRCSEYCENKGLNCDSHQVVKVLEDLGIISFRFGLHDNYFVIN